MVFSVCRWYSGGSLSQVDEVQPEITYGCFTAERPRYFVNHDQWLITVCRKRRSPLASVSKPVRIGLWRTCVYVGKPLPGGPHAVFQPFHCYCEKETSRLRHGQLLVLGSPRLRIPIAKPKNLGIAYQKRVSSRSVILRLEFQKLNDSLRRHGDLQVHTVAGRQNKYWLEARAVNYIYNEDLLRLISIFWSYLDRQQV